MYNVSYKSAINTTICQETKTMNKKMREEYAIFNDLSKLCSTPGYIHAIAFLCLENVIPYRQELKPKDMMGLYSTERLIRTEICTLIGLMYKNGIDLTLPSPQKIQFMIRKTKKLLKELHYHFLSYIKFDDFLKGDEQENPFANGPAMREPISYGSESAYQFQYRELCLGKYNNDDDWLIKNKGFSIKDAVKVLKGIIDFQNLKLKKASSDIFQDKTQNWTILHGYTFTANDLTDYIDYIDYMDLQIVNNVLRALIPPTNMNNQNFNTINDFNVINAYPILELNNGEYVLFNQFSLSEALYETPFYWLIGDGKYSDYAMGNRGSFTETFCKKRLEHVFGQANAFRNVNILSGKKTLGEIDVFVVFANRAIILQAKSKRLTLEARKGNDNVLKDDFKKSIQDSYDQALLCSKLITNTDFILQDSNSSILKIPRDFKEIYIFCVVSDHYPALSFQARQFLRYEQSERIMPPFIMDIFLLDVMVEMLSSPLLFLSYINRRVTYIEAVLAPDELVILSYHLCSNLWISDKNTNLVLENDLGVDIDLAMLVRREGIPGPDTPEGILTKYRNTAFDNLIREIEKDENPSTIDLGFLLLKLSGDTITDINRTISIISERSRADGKTHDSTILFGGMEAGLTIHSSSESIEIAGPSLQRHCELRKYICRVNDWFGICIDPEDMSLRFGIQLNYEWKQSDIMDSLTEKFPKGDETRRPQKNENQNKDIGRNSLCPCGSGKKYKKCCGK